MSEWPKGCPPPAGYVAWHEWASAQRKHGLKQTQCRDCGRYYFPQEKDQHDHAPTTAAQREDSHD